MLYLPEPWGGVVFATWWIGVTFYAIKKEPMYYPPRDDTYRDRFYKEANAKPKSKNNKPLIIDVD